MTEIQNDDPIPPSRKKYPFADLEIGQHFYMAGENAAILLRGAASYYTKGGKTFTVRTVIVDEIKGAKVWRCT